MFTLVPLVNNSPEAVISSLEWKCSAVIVPLALILPEAVTWVLDALPNSIVSNPPSIYNAWSSLTVSTLKLACAAPFSLKTGPADWKSAT